jgi:DNA-binding protein HU-beta/integration host factor subunit alpha
MNKRDLVVRISAETRIVQHHVLDVVQKTLDHIAEAVTQGRKVELRNFGVFEVKTRKARVGRNPHAPASDVRIPPRAVVKFKPGKEMREAVIRLSPDGLPPEGSEDSESAAESPVTTTLQTPVPDPTRLGSSPTE